ncbi:glutamate [NMDA] receptor subunit 1-like [Penaeus chinensis]|uniref:glutamate [NMDA] receptor subunit 1-like n=1 Tax=Penaeus chinensis TaxID=139456 RepID=UPI001FB5ABED|nr:glutamate [NMDA] receptor subunit 1-like [Penaeus chinensis]
MDVTEYLYLDEMSAAYKRPVLQSDIAGFLKPYSLLMWMLVLVATAGVFVAICLVHLAYNRVTQNHSGEDRSFLQASDLVQESAAWTLSALLAQSVARPLRGGDSVRLVTGVWLLASLIVATVYRSNLKAMLILPKLVLPFNSLEELVETDLPVWIRMGSNAHEAIVNADANTTLGKLRKQMYHGHRFEAVTRLDSGEHVLAVPLSSLQQMLHNSFSRTGKCITYIMSGGFMQTTTLSFVIRKGSPLKQQMDPIIRRLRESGLLDYAYHRAIANSTECLREIRVNPSDNSRVLVLGDFYGIFLVYATGIAIASLTFLAEVLVHLFK